MNDRFFICIIITVSFNAAVLLIIVPNLTFEHKNYEKVKHKIKKYDTIVASKNVEK